jgi:3-mercaptopyruvate sulfurtransferase SseA
MSEDGEEQWAERAKRFFKAELKRADVTYDDLAEKLSKMGLSETKASIANKISRGTFSAAFLLASLKAIGCQTVRVEDL